MDHHDHVNLLRRAVTTNNGAWADFGSGEGAFTLALRELGGAECEIYSLEKDRSRLAQQERNMRARFPDSRLHLFNVDFTRGLDLPPLDGILMANALHFFRAKDKLLGQLYAYLKPGGKFVLVEYNVDAGNMWVPYPLSFDSFRELAPRAGFTRPELLATHPSRFLREIYSALTLKAASI